MTCTSEEEMSKVIMAAERVNISVQVSSWLCTADPYSADLYRMLHPDLLSGFMVFT